MIRLKKNGLVNNNSKENVCAVRFISIFGREYTRRTNGHVEYFQVLCLNHNKIECIMPKQKGMSKQRTTNMSNTSLKNSVDLYSSEAGLTPVLDNLEVLHLG